MRNENFCAPDYDLFGGLDVDKRSLSVTFTNHQGFMGSLHTPNSAEYLVNHARKHFAELVSLVVVEIRFFGIRA